MRDQRFLFVIPYLYEGGAQRAMSAVQMHFPDDWKIDTLINSDWEQKYPVKGQIYSLGVDRKPQTDSVLFQFFVLLKRIRTLKSLKKKNSYVACISFIDSANIANILTPCKGTKTIVSVRTSLKAKSSSFEYRYIINPLVRLLYNRADRVVAVSEELRHELIKDFGIRPEKVIAIKNGFDLSEISRLKEIPLADDIHEVIKNKKIVITTGRLAPVKCQKNLIRAFGEVKKSIPDSMLLIAGEGSLYDDLIHLVESLNLTDSVILLGHVDNVYAYLAVSDVFVLPSLHEGFPNSLGEAMCVGLPCIATDFRTGAREIIAPDRLYDDKAVLEVTRCEYGILTPIISDNNIGYEEPLSCSEIELARAISVLLRDDDMRMEYSQKSRERAGTMDIKLCIDRWVEVITD